MLPVKKVLCPTDFSEPSYTALAAASELAAHFGAALIMVHVIEFLPPCEMENNPLFFNVLERERQAREEAGRKLQQVIAERLLLRHGCDQLSATANLLARLSTSRAKNALM